MKNLLLATLGCLLVWASFAASASKNKENGYATKVGKKGDITLTEPTKLADKVLEPGTYVVQHRDSGRDHFVRFLNLKQVRESGGKQSFTYTAKENVGEVKCQIQPTSAPNRNTTVYIVNESGGARITKVAIKGEEVVHVF